MSTEPRVKSIARRVLIVDDNRTKYQELVNTLKESGIETQHADNRSYLMDEAEKFAPDIILINLVFNGASSLPQIRALKAALHRQGTKILVITKHNLRENIIEAIKAGAVDFVTDPFESRFLVQRIRYQLQDRETYSADDLRAEPTQVLAGFQLLYDCLRILAEVPGTHQSVVAVLQKVGELSQSSRVNIVTGSLESSNGFVMATSDDPTLQDKPVDLEKYPEVREVLLNGSIVFIKDITANPLTKNITALVKDIKIQSMLVLPIRHRSLTMGALCIRLANTADGKGTLDITDKHLKTFYMVGLAMGAKVAAYELLKKMKKQSPESK